MKSRRDFIKSRCDFNFMQQLLIFSSPHYKFFPNNGEKNCARKERKVIK